MFLKKMESYGLGCTRLGTWSKQSPFQCGYRQMVEKSSLVAV